MSRICLYDRDNQCFEDCPDCSRYSPRDECCCCGEIDDIYYIDGNYFCRSCLDKAVIDRDGIIRNKDVLTEFIYANGELYEKFLREWFSECRV